MEEQTPVQLDPRAANILSLIEAQVNLQHTLKHLQDQLTLTPRLADFLVAAIGEIEREIEMNKEDLKHRGLWWGGTKAERKEVS